MITPRNLAVLVIFGSLGLHAQQTAGPIATVPRLVRITNSFHPADGSQPAPIESVTLSIYREECDGAPLWQETQNVSVDVEGRYNVLMGSSLPDGMPLDSPDGSHCALIGIDNTGALTMSSVACP